MTKFIGRRLSVGIGKETVRGEGVAAEFWLNCLSFNHSDKVIKARSDGLLGSISQGHLAMVAQKWAEGNMEAELNDKSFGLILLALFGTVSSANLETTAYKHTFSLQEDNLHDSLSIHTVDPIGALHFMLAMIDELTIDFMPDEIVKFTVTFKSKNSAGGEAVKSYVAENKFLGRHLALKLGATTADLTAASKIKPKSVRITITKNTEIVNALGTVQPIDIVNKMFSIAGEIVMDYEDRTYKNYMLDGDYKAMRLDLVNEDVTIGAISNPAFRLDLSKVDFDSWEPDFSLNEIVAQTIQFQAMFDLSGNDNIINDCYIQNEETSY